MPRNVEIKAVVRDFDRIRSLAENLCNSEPEVLHQQDTFYRVSQGRLKIRNFQNDIPSQLVFYSRPDTEGPKLSDYSLSPVSNPDELHEVLSAALGQLGVVKKTRYLYLFGQTRIHLDQVEGLGNFMELEVVLTPEQTLEQGKQIADELMLKLEVSERDLISGAYLDQIV